MRKMSFAINEIYHIYNRGVEKRNIFTNEKDRFRFTRGLVEFNDINPVLNAGYYFENYHGEKYKSDIKRKPLVDILAFCLMSNHFHLLLREKIDNGITSFMRKLGTGYTNYFNIKYDRVGPLFQGTFKSVLVNKEKQLLYLPHYIHLNPLDLTSPKWRSGKLFNVTKAIDYLDSYRWSSYLDYTNKINFPNLTQRTFLSKIYGSGTSIDYKNDLIEWLKGTEMDSIQDIILE